MTNVLICIGNGTDSASLLAEDLAAEHGLTFRGFLDQYTEIVEGCYHTSIYDIKLQALLNKLESQNQIKIIVLEQRDSDYPCKQDYYDTVTMAEELRTTYQVEFVDPAMSNPFKKILSQNKSFCILPFISLFPHKEITKHCCWMDPWDTDYTDFYTDPNTKLMRDQMINGERISNCHNCYNFEDLGFPSPRETYTIDWTNRLNLKSLDDAVQNTKLIRYDVSIGNYCNLQCRMCNPRSSTLVDNEYFELKMSDTKIGELPASGFDQIDLDAVQQVLVAGGEPSINKDFYNFLKRCIKEGKTDFEIFISSNVVSLPKEFIALISQFKNIKISISVDGFDQVNHYIRWPSNWQKITENIQRLKEVLSPHNYYFNTTVSIYNISRLYELFEFLDLNYFTSNFSMNILEYPNIQQPWNFPDKAVALENLNKIKNLKKYQTDTLFNTRINGLIQRIENCEINYNQLVDFFKFNDQLDQSRSIKLADYIPELDGCRPG